MHRWCLSAVFAVFAPLILATSTAVTASAVPVAPHVAQGAAREVPCSESRGAVEIVWKKGSTCLLGTGQIQVQTPGTTEIRANNHRVYARVWTNGSKPKWIQLLPHETWRVQEFTHVMELELIQQ